MQKNITFSSAPISLQEAIFNTYKERAPGCIVNNEFIETIEQDTLIRAYIPDSFASVLIGCEGGAIGLFMHKGEEWVFLQATQDSYSCEVLEENDVPSQIITGYTDIIADCFEPSGNTRPVNS